MNRVLELLDAARDVASLMRKRASEVVDRWRYPGRCRIGSGRCAIREEEEIEQRTMELGLLGGAYMFLDTIGSLTPYEDAMFQGVFAYHAAHIGSMIGRKREACDRSPYRACSFGLGAMS